MSLHSEHQTQNAVTSVPGKVLLAGEYSVLFGGQALASTIEATITTDCESKRTSGTPEFSVSSDLWDKPIIMRPDQEPKHPKASVVYQTLQFVWQRLPQSGKIKITTDFDPSYGFGSSAGVRLGILRNLLNYEPDFWQAARDAYSLQKLDQGNASGYDIATQSLGGLVHFAEHCNPKDWPRGLEQLQTSASFQKNVQLWVGGKGAPTKETIAAVLPWIETQKLLPTLMSSTSALIQDFSQFNQLGDEQSFRSLIGAVSEHRKIFEQCPRFPHTLFNELKECAGFDDSWTAKTTGAGGEDAVLLIGTKKDTTLACSKVLNHGWRQFSQNFSVAAASTKRKLQ